MAKKAEKKAEVVVKEDTSVFINGREIKVKKGVQTIDPDVARILVEAGYAEVTQVEPEESEEQSNKGK